MMNKKREQKSEKFKLNIMQHTHDECKWNDWYGLENLIQYINKKQNSLNIVCLLCYAIMIALIISIKSQH